MIKIEKGGWINEVTYVVQGKVMEDKWVDVRMFEIMEMAEEYVEGFRLDESRFEEVRIIERYMREKWI